MTTTIADQRRITSSGSSRRSRLLLFVAVVVRVVVRVGCGLAIVRRVIEEGQKGVLEEGVLEVGVMVSISKEYGALKEGVVVY